jgi:hypothetical protein
MKPPTREELISEKTKIEAELQQTNIRLLEDSKINMERDKDIREHLSIALGAGTYSKGHYSDDRVHIVYSWFSIFREIGKLLERKKQADVEDEVKFAHERLDRVDRRIEEIANPQTRENPEPFRSR